MLKTLSILFSLLILAGCNGTEKKEQSTRNIKEEGPPPNVLLERQQFDFDQNGIQDTFEMYHSYDPDLIQVHLNGKTYRFEPVSVFFDSIKITAAQKLNLLQSHFFVVLEIAPNIRLLYVKDKGDFAGPVNLIYGLNEGAFKCLLEEQFEPVAIEVNDDSTYLVVKEIGNEPGFYKGYTYINYSLFRAYNLSRDAIGYDSLMSNNYNLNHNPGFDQYLKMKKPVLGVKEKSHQRLKLMDLDTVH